MISNATQRTIARIVHLIFAIPIAGYVYSPFEQLPDYAPTVRYVAVPVIILTGLLMWKGHLLRRIFSNGTAQAAADGQ